MELRLREFDRCRTLYEKWLEAQPTNPTAWIKFAELEKLLSDHERVRAIFELAVEQPGVDMPELLWKAYIDFEYAEGEFERTRALYERLLERTSHVKVWCSFAQFEFNAGNALADVYMGIDADDDEDDEGERGERPEPDEAAATQARAEGLERAAGVLKRAYDDMRAKQLKEERVVVLETWKSLAAQAHDSAMLDKVQAMLPRVVKRMRKVDGDATIMEECTLTYLPGLRRGGLHSLILFIAAQTTISSSRTTRPRAQRRARASSSLRTRGSKSKRPNNSSSRRREECCFRNDS